MGYDAYRTLQTDCSAPLWIVLNKTEICSTYAYLSPPIST